jgi:hypothetical protein
VRESAWLALPFPWEEGYGFGVAALAFLEEALAVAAEFVRLVFCHSVGAVVSDDVVDAVAQGFDSFQEDARVGF